jgi:hypothetical protein
VVGDLAGKMKRDCRSDVRVFFFFFSFNFAEKKNNVVGDLVGKTKRHCRCAFPFSLLFFFKKKVRRKKIVNRFFFWKTHFILQEIAIPLLFERNRYSSKSEFNTNNLS